MSVIVLKRCRICKKPKREEEFYSRDGGKKHTACKECLVKRNVTHVKNNKERRNAYMRQYLRDLKSGKRDREGYTLIAEAKKQPCKDCGGSFPEECMDFDHIEGATKKFNVSQALLRSTETLKLEIAKCEVVCSNCHRIRTRKRLLQSIVTNG